MFNMLNIDFTLLNIFYLVKISILFQCICLHLWKVLFKHFWSFSNAKNCKLFVQFYCLLVLHFIQFLIFYMLEQKQKRKAGSEWLGKINVSIKLNHQKKPANWKSWNLKCCCRSIFELLLLFGLTKISKINKLLFCSCLFLLFYSLANNLNCWEIALNYQITVASLLCKQRNLWCKNRRNDTFGIFKFVLEYLGLS